MFYSKFQMTRKRKYIVDFCADAGIQNMTKKKNVPDFEFISTMKISGKFSRCLKKIFFIEFSTVIGDFVPILPDLFHLTGQSLRSSLI